MGRFDGSNFPFYPSSQRTHSNVLASSRKTIISYVSLQLLFTRCTHVIDSSSIIEDIQTISLTELAILATFYFDLRDIAKLNGRNLLSSVLVQLCQQSDRFSQVLSSVCSTYGDGSREHSTSSACEGVSPDVRECGLHGQPAGCQKRRIFTFPMPWVPVWITGIDGQGVGSSRGVTHEEYETPGWYTPMKASVESQEVDS